GHLAKAGASALVLFGSDGKESGLSYIEGRKMIRLVESQDWVQRLVGELRKKARGGMDAEGAARWVQETLQAQAERRERERKRPYHNGGLFSEHYLETRLRESPEWQEDLEPIRKELLEFVSAKEGLLQGANEAATEEELIQPILQKLGFSYSVQATTRATGGVLKPDYVLYPDEATKLRALKSKEESGRYAPALAILEAKYFERPLDLKRRDDRDRTHSPVSPAFQLTQYLASTGVAWGILTNGRKWRLYSNRVADKGKRFFEVDLWKASEDPEAFRFFWLFFRKDAFMERAQGSFLDRLLEGSKGYGLRVGEGLKETVFREVFPKLAEGFLHYHKEVLGRPIEGGTLGEVYRATLTLLYRLLFLLYAEDRDLLPVWDTLGYGQHSLSKLRKDAAQGIDEGRVYTEHTYKLWNDLTELFRIIDGGSPALRVPPYNGGLFRKGPPLLETHRLADAFLAPALDGLSRQPDEDGTRRFVDYRYLSVRELGAIYEGLLEYHLELDADGKPYLVNDKGERRLTGSYYTPDYVVEYIVGRSLEPLVKERREALKGVLKEYNYLKGVQEKNPSKDNAPRLAALRQKALDTLLDVKVLDPAMGSGHFLVSATDYLSERFANLITELRAEPVVDALAELRGEIREQMGEYNLKVPPERISDMDLLKRMVVKRCIFGVDLNPMAVELAKLSLWLDTFTVGVPLSFLDHGLRHGNSVLGVSKAEFLRW
ncbi:MAG: DNA methyltransferase, partial [Thermaceae bacterium]